MWITPPRWVADGWTYGFPELIGRDKVANATRVTNPGCYPTGFLALLAPLIRKGLLPSAIDENGLGHGSSAVSGR